MIKEHSRIETINWLDKDAQEAEVLVQVNGRLLWTFCHPCKFVQGELSFVRFSPLIDKIAEETFWTGNKDGRKDIEQAVDDKLRYYCNGRIIAIHPVLCDCGVTTLSIGDWINDEGVIGKYIYFVVSRLDVEKAE